jgi:hypothetical protein
MPKVSARDAGGAEAKSSAHWIFGLSGERTFAHREVHEGTVAHDGEKQ